MIDRLNRQGRNFKFFVLANNAPRSHLYQRIKVDIASDGLGMKDQLIKQNIDVVYIGSLWPETFCLTAYEAIAAGTFVVANYLSGNVVDIVEKTQKGMIYRGLDNICSFLSDKKNQKKIIMRRKNKQYFDLQESMMTLSEIIN